MRPPLLSRAAEEIALTIDDAGSLAPPTAIGPYRVLHQVGAGVLGPVFRAHGADDNREVAVKLFKLDLTPEQARELADGLARLCERVPAHPHIAACVGAGLAGSTAWLAQEYVPADALDARLRRRTGGGLKHSLPVLRQIAAAIDAAADRGLHHGALHPRDVLISTTGEVRVTGFGVADAVAAAGGPAVTRRPYAAPERSGTTQRPADAAADVFSLGTIAVEMLTGRRPIGTGATAVGFVSGVAEGVDADACRRALARALADAPRERFATATAFVAALARAAETEGEAPPRVAEEGHAAPAQDRSAAVDAPPAEPVAADTPAPPSGADSEETTVRTAAVPEPGAKLPKQARPLVSREVRSPAPTPVAPESPVHAEREATGSPPKAPGAVLRPERAPSLERPVAPPARRPREPHVREAEPRDASPAERPALTLGASREPRPASPPVEIEAHDLSHPVIDVPASSLEVHFPISEAETSTRTEPVAPPEVSPAPLIDTVAPPAGLQSPTTTEATTDGAPMRHQPRLRSSAALLLIGLGVGLLVGYVLWGRGSRPGAGQGPVAASATAETGATSPGGRQAAGTDTPSSAPQDVSAPQPEPSTPLPPPTAAPALSAAPAPARGRVLVRSRPSGARVSVNGRSRGETPVTIDDLPLGTHELTLVRQGYQPTTRRVTLKTSRTVSLTVSLQRRPAEPTPRAQGGEPKAQRTKAGSEASGDATLEVVSRPSGARVFVDGKLAGTTPLTTTSIAPGSHAVRLELAGHRPWTTSVTLERARRTRVAGSLEPVP